MTYLLSQIFISLLLAAVAGGAVGWIVRGLKAHKRERELGGLVERHSSALAQAQQERQMIADDYDEMQLGLESKIGELQVENRRIPELHENLTKSQQLVQQMMKTRESEIADSQQQSDQLKQELDSLRVQQKNDHSEIAALRKINAELGGNKNQTETVVKSDSIGESDADSVKEQNTNRAVTTQEAATNLNHSPAVTGSDAKSTPATTNSATSVASGVSGFPGGTTTNPAETDSRHIAPEQNQLEPFSTDELQDVLGESADRAAVTQAELLELESEIEEMRGYNRDHDYTSDRLDSQRSGSSNTKSDVSRAGPAFSETPAPLAGQRTSLDETPRSLSSSAVPDASAVAELREHFSAGGDPEAIDDLQTIHGIGPVIEKSLNEIGITNYHQIAELTRREIEDIAEILEIFPGRIERDNWIGSARKLAGDSSDQTTDNVEIEAQKEAGKVNLQAEEV